LEQFKNDNAAFHCRSAVAGGIGGGTVGGAAWALAAPPLFFLGGRDPPTFKF